MLGTRLHRNMLLLHLPPSPLWRNPRTQFLVFVHRSINNFFSHKKKLEMAVCKERNRRKYHALEVRRLVSGKSTHIGYIRFRFTRKEDAACFYNTYNPHMPPLTEERNWISECDPITHLFYSVTELDRVALTIAPFANVEWMQAPWTQPATQRVEPFPRCLRCIF